MPLLRIPSEHTNEQAERLLSVEEVADALSVSKTTAYALCWEGQLPSLKLGRRRLVRRADLSEFIERQQEASSG
jgi:excisionase family DNA binding protein